MNIVLISDLHINPSIDYSLVGKFCECLRGRIYPPTKEVVIFVIGDITNEGNKEYYKDAVKVFDFILEQMRGWKVTFEFVPGNHDICSKNIEDFDNFIERYQSTKHRFSENSAYSKIHEDINFIFASSTVDYDYHYGNIDLKSIKANIIPDKQNVLLIHHSLISEDHTTIANIPELQKLLNENHIKFVFHGHSHTGRYLSNLNGIHLIGTGSLLAPMKGNQNNQFNLLGIDFGRVISIANFRYTSDRGHFDLSSDIYPERREYTDPSKIEKYCYQSVENYINRKVWQYSDASVDEVTRILNSVEKVSLLEVCETEKKLIVLLADAGTGKSYELDQVAHILSKKESPYYPVRYDLKLYNGEKLTDLLNGEFEEYKFLPPDCLFWIFDGYDEIEARYVLDFKRNLEKYRKDYPKGHILLSSRTNFLRTKTPDGNRGTFLDSAEYILSSLGSSDIIDYLNANGVNPEKFVNEISEKGLSGLDSIPFYLIQLAKIYKDNGNLPNKYNLMDTLIQKSFQKDITKFEYAVELDAFREELFKILERAAFSVQLLNKNSITDIEYQQIFSIEDRTKLQFSGLWEKRYEAWTFSHNNFREYLAARLLSTLELTRILDYVKYSDSNEIKPNWLNTLSFLLSIYKAEDLVNWLSTNAPYALIKFESDRLSREMRFSILKTIYSERKEKNLWFEREGLSELELARFSESVEAIDYLLNEIESLDSEHFRAQYIALSLLFSFNDYYDKVDTMRDSLISYLSKPKMQSNQAMAIRILGRKEIYSLEITQHLMTQFSKVDDASIRSGLYEYLTKNNCQDNYVRFFLEGLHYAEERNIKDMDEFITLSDGLMKFSTSNAIKEALIFLSSSRYPMLYNEIEIFESLCKKAEDLYKNGDITIFDTFLEILYKSEELMTQYLKRILQFFYNTNTKKSALHCLLKKDLKHKVFVLRDFIGSDSDSLNEFARMYKNDELLDRNLFYEFTEWMSQSLEEFITFSELLREYEGKEIPKRPIINYEQLEKEGKQNYFNYLFDENSLRELHDQLLSLYGKNLTKEELINIVPMERRHDIELLKRGIYRYGNSVDCISDFFHKVSWKSFSIHEIYNLLSRDKNSLLISEAQTQYLNDIFNQIIDSTDFNTDTIFENDSEYTINWAYLCVVCFMKKLSFRCSEEKLLDMVMIPPVLFKDEDFNKNALNYISQYVSPEILKKRIIFNIANRQLMGDVFISHIEYCTEYELTEAIALALQACKEPSRSLSVKRAAYNYLLKIKGEEYIYDQVVPYVNDELFMDIVQGLYRNMNDKLKDAMIERYSISGNIQLLRYLLFINSEYGLDEYIRLLQKSHKTPEDGNLYPEITESVQYIRDIKLLPGLILLSKLRFQKGFEDKSFINLYNCLLNALIAMGSKENYETVKTAIEKLRYDLSDEANCKFFCNYILDEIQKQNLKDMDKKYEIREIKGIFSDFDLM